MPRSHTGPGATAAAAATRVCSVRMRTAAAGRRSRSRRTRTGTARASTTTTSSICTPGRSTAGSSRSVCVDEAAVLLEERLVPAGEVFHPAVVEGEDARGRIVDQIAVVRDEDDGAGI